MAVTLSNTIKDIKNDIPERFSIKSFLRNYLYSPGFRLLLNHRLGKFFYFKGFLFKQIGLYYRKQLVVKRGCDISYKAVIGKKVSFPHAIGIVIGDGVVIQDNVKIWQQVTFGSHGKPGKDLQYPVIESGVKIFAGAKIIGGVTIGKNSIIGANSLVNKDVPPNSVAYGIPCKIKTIES